MIFRKREFSSRLGKRGGFNYPKLGVILFFYLQLYKVKPQHKRSLRFSKRVHSKFVKDFLTASVNYVIETGDTLRLPYDLGYLAVSEHQNFNKDIDHINKFYGLDYSLTWRLHDMFKFHIICQYKAIKKLILEQVDKGTEYRTDIQCGDIYYLRQNKYVVERGIDRFYKSSDNYITRTQAQVGHL